MKRSKYNLSHFRNTSCRMGELVPIGCAEVLHGDTFKHNTNMFMRLSPLANPIMHPVHTHIHHYYVPMRLLWDKWEDFITGGEDLDDASVVPTIDFSASPVVAGSLANHLGLPVGFDGEANAFPFRAMALIYNEIYRDDQLQDKVGFSKESGADTDTNTELLNANWSKDPFTTARPDDQLGNEVSIPLGGQAPVHGIGPLDTETTINTWHNIKEADGNIEQYTRSWNSASHNIHLKADDVNGYPDIYADLASATATSLDDLRLAIATQKWQERINRTGNKYNDYLKRDGVNYSDARIQRPVFLGGGKQTVQFSEVLDTGNDVGDMKGHGIAALRSNNYMKYFEEEGLVISLMHTKPISMYTQALHKQWSRRTKEEFYQKQYEQIPMQEVKNKEINHAHNDPDGTFGYTTRNNEYRRLPNTVHGQFATSTLNDWHLARALSNDVALNSSFITCVPDDRIFQDQTEDAHHLYCTIQHKIAARRIVTKNPGSKGITL